MRTTATILAGALAATCVGVAAPQPPAKKAAAQQRPASAQPARQAQPAKPAPAPDLFEVPGPVTPAGEIDRIVLAKLETLGIRPALCTDAVFLRRAHMDVIGTLPTAAEARAFLEEPDSEAKRARLIDRLLERPEFAVYWSMKWADILRIKAEFPVNLWPNAAQAYDRWVKESVARNKPYDRFARELLTSSGSNFRVGPVNFYRAIQDRTPEGIAAAVALTLMGVRVDSWPEGRLAGMAVFFSEVGYKPSQEWKEELVYWDPDNAKDWAKYVTAREEERERARREAAERAAAAAKAQAAAKRSQKAGQKKGTKPVAQPAPAAAPASAAAPVEPPPERPAERGSKAGVFPDGTRVALSPERDPRAVFADWLVRPENPWFTKNIVNRLWSWLLGRGIIEEPDDIRDDNPPSNPELLAYLEREMIAGRYDMRRMYRMILNSRTYQFSAVPKSTRPEAAANFASYLPRRLPAEVLIDNVNAITGTTDLYTSAIPEPFTYIPKDMPAIGVADGSITSSFLTLFGRSARATGMEGERINAPQPSQMLHMLNSSHIRGKIERGPKLLAILSARQPPRKIAEELYLTILSRFPTQEELRKLEAYGAGKPYKSRDEWLDIAWALINSNEALYRH